MKKHPVPVVVTYMQIAPASPLPAISSEPFRTVVVAAMAVSPEWQGLVSKWLVQAGCLYMMAWGPNSSSWDDSVDMANLDRFDFGEIPDTSSVVTTWHDDEPIEEVFWFSKNAAEHPDVELCHTIILDISAENRSIQVLECYAAA